MTLERRRRMAPDACEPGTDTDADEDTSHSNEGPTTINTTTTPVALPQIPSYHQA